MLLSCVGCGTTHDKLATEQLLLSDAVDRAVAHIDFTPLQGETVFLDTQYIKQLKSNPNSFVNQDYIISSLRQQMLQAGCLLQENRETADYIAEARVGALGTDGHDVNYGVPPSQTMSAAASVVSRGMMLPALPEISLARRTDDTAAAKIAVFAYQRESKVPVWQSGLSVARSRAQGRWVLGAGPFQSGTIYQGTQFAGEGLRKKPRNLPEDEAYRNAAVWDQRLQRSCGTARPRATRLSPRVPSRPSRPESRAIAGVAGKTTAADHEPPQPEDAPTPAPLSPRRPRTLRPLRRCSAEPTEARRPPRRLGWATRWSPHSLVVAHQRAMIGS